MSFDSDESFWAKENYSAGMKAGRAPLEIEVQRLRAKLEVARRNQLRALVDVLMEFKEDDPELFEVFRDSHYASFVKIEKLIRKRRVK